MMAPTRLCNYEIAQSSTAKMQDHVESHVLDTSSVQGCGKFPAGYHREESRLSCVQALFKLRKDLRLHWLAPF
jgi:hypothetical protein